MALILAVAAVLLSAGLTGFARRYARHAGMLDQPNARSAHQAPTARGGGVAIVVVVLGGLPIVAVYGSLSVSALVALWLSAALIAGIGWVDDRSDLAAIWRVAVHGVSTLTIVMAVDGGPPLPLPWGEWQWGSIGSVMLVLFGVWITNLYNFMDGIDGLAGVEAVTVAGAATLVLGWQDGSEWSLLPLLLMSASFGFLVWNWPPARIFMGDVGSGFLGFFFGAMALLTSVYADLNLWVWLILLGCFVVDASLTLLRRVLARQRFYEAHSSHAYQHAARYYGSHRSVTLAIGVVNLVWLMPLAAIAAAWPAWGAVVLVVAWAPLLITALIFRAGVAP